MLLLVAFNPQARGDREPVGHIEAVLHEKGVAGGGIDTVGGDRAGTRVGAGRGDSLIDLLFLHDTHADFGLAGHAEEPVGDSETGIQTDTVEGAVVAVDSIRVNPASGGGRGSVVDRETPVVAVHLAPVDHGVEAHTGADFPHMVEVERFAFGQEVVVRRGVVLGSGVVFAKEQAAIGNIGVVFVISEFRAQPLVIAQRHAGLDHEVLHIESFVLEAVA